MNLKNIIDFLQQYFEIPINIWANDEEARKFEIHHCFHKEAQPRNTATYLNKLKNTLDKPTILTIREPLGTVVILLYIENEFVLLGPFTEVEWNKNLGEHALMQVNLSVSFLQQFKSYYCSYPVWKADAILKAIQIFFMIKEFDSKIYVDEFSVTPKKETQRIEDELEKNSFDINYTYMVETEFMEAIQRGNSKEALLALKKIREKSERTNYHQNKSFMQIIGFTLWRTHCRMAAKQAGLPPIIINAISQKYVQKLYNSDYERVPHNTNSLIEEMVLDYCKEINQFHKDRYPATIRKAVDYIKLNLGSNLSTSLLADKINVQSTYLSKQFKSAMGMSITRFIQLARVQKAAELLCISENDIQDISQFVGYEDNNYFVKIFKRYYNLTPSEYRNRYML